MGGGLLLALALAAGDTALAGSLTLELRVFDGLEDVTSQTRISVHRAGERTAPVIQLSAGRPSISAGIPPGIYDVQAIRERDGRVLGIRWAQRLVVMAYPDEDGRHLEVINFQNGFGALEVRRRDRMPPEAALYSPGERTKTAAAAIPRPGCHLFVAPAGPYDLRTGGAGQEAWHNGLELPLDRTRLWVVPER
jgi:hypothetical protein